MNEQDVFRPIAEALGSGIKVLIYLAEQDDVSPDEGPFRARAFVFPSAKGDLVLIGSGATLEEAMRDLSTGLAAGERPSKVIAPTI